MKQAKGARKVAAAVTAVLQYIAEREAVGPVVESVSAPPLSPPCPAAAWGMTGRQDAMLFRTLWQRRLTKTW